MATAKAAPPASKQARPAPAATLFAQKAILWWIPILYLLITDAFYLRTYDSAQVKITLVQMGGVCLFSLWLCRLIEQGMKAFSKEDLVCLAPFLAWFGFGVLSYLHAPYKYSSLDFFLRRLFYGTVALIVIREFREDAVSRLTRVLVWATWITVGYGFLQWFDVNFFPPGIGKGPDPFIWRGAFGERVFSTFGNPNFFADFLVVIFPVLVCQYLKTRRMSLIPLMFLTVFDLFMTETKGAWIGLAVSVTLFVSTYAWFFDTERLKQHWKPVLAGFLAIFLVVGFGVFSKLQNSRWTSVNFRLFTWEGTWEMVMSQPVIGNGLGSFWVIYPAYRRPPIFHIEGKHNTETDHSENEWLEVLFDEGILGFGIFLWLVLSTCVVAWRSLGQLTGSLKRGQRAPPRAYDLLGYLIALQGMLAHNLFDVSMRFVSSGIYLGLLSGLVVNLARGISLAELDAQREEPPAQGLGARASGAARPSAFPGAAPEGPGAWETLSSFLIWPLRLAAWTCLAYTGFLLWTEFAELQGPRFRMQLNGEILQWWIAWAAFAFCILSQGYIFGRVVLLSRNILVPALVALVLLPPIPKKGLEGPLYRVWGHFKADVHHNIAIFFSKRQEWEQALKNYLIVGKLNPAFVMANYFKGNVFNDRFNMTKVYNPNWGDTGDKPRDDFERALAAYQEVHAQAPNYVQSHHQLGVLYMKRAEWEAGQGRPPEAEKALDTALDWFHKYRNIDPVFPPNYYRIGQIHLMRKHYDKAIETYKALLEALECRVDPPLAQRGRLRKTVLAYQEYLERDASWLHVHETPEAFTQLANAYFMAGRLPEAEKAYRRALDMDPKYEHAKRNLQILYQRAQSEGRLRIIQPELPKGVPATPPLLEVIQKK